VNKLVQIQKEASILSRKRIQVEKKKRNTNLVLVTVQKKVNPTEKNKQQELLIDTQLTKSILTKERVKMNKNRGVMISAEKEHKMNKLSRKREVSSNKAINK